MKTQLHTYRFNLANVEEREPYIQLCNKLKNTPGRGRWMNCISTTRKDCPAGEVELEESFLFDNQWNTESGFRVFDWYEEFYPQNRLIKDGHYLDITQEMIDIRNNNCVCGYCGEKYPTGQQEFCNKCLSSSYLKEDDLPLLRLVPISSKNEKRKPLTEAEREFLMNGFVEGQTNIAKEKQEKKLAELHADYEKTVRLAKLERDGFLWFIEQGIPVDNCIFYNHTERFCFGWRNRNQAQKSFTGAAREALLAKLARCPFNYDVE